MRFFLIGFLLSVSASVYADISQVVVVNKVNLSTTTAIPVSGSVSVSNIPSITTVTFNGTAQPVSGSVSVANIPAVTTITFNGTAQPVNFNGVGQPVTSTSTTVNQATNSNLRASVMIDGSSNTVQAAQSGTWSMASTTTFNGIGQPVVSTYTVVFISPSSNTVTSTPAVGSTTTVTFNGVSNPVTITGPVGQQNMANSIPTVLATEQDLQYRRLLEYQVLAAQEASIREVLIHENSPSQNQGFEIR